MELLLADTDRSGWPWTHASIAFPDTMPGGEPWPRISIVTPSFDQGRYIEETIRSVLLQGYPNLEYFVIDGGSTDNSVELIKRYEPWLSYWESLPDRGQSHAINKGFEQATGHILAWINSDDVYAPDSLRIAAETLVGKQKTLLVGDSILTYDDEGLDGHRDRRRPSWREMAYEARSWPQPSVFWTHDLWELAGELDEALHFAMDFDLWLRMRPLADQVLYADEILSFARSHAEQKSFIADEQNSAAQEFTTQRAFAALRSAKSRGELALLWLMRCWYWRISTALRNRNRSQLKGSAFHWAATRLVLFLPFNPDRGRR